ncbi:hypothetical protein LCGC14_3042060 [marine sediment metagenome]|uniref:Uncharacterized protein n=1 Tax=marine sediment metagenome TaxID=412755 RepID=A0A0F8YX82_9ZZZZ
MGLPSRAHNEFSSASRTLWVADDSEFDPQLDRGVSLMRGVVAFRRLGIFECERCEKRFVDGRSDDGETDQQHAGMHLDEVPQP